MSGFRIKKALSLVMQVKHRMNIFLHLNVKLQQKRLTNRLPRQKETTLLAKITHSRYFQVNRYYSAIYPNFSTKKHGFPGEKQCFAKREALLCSAER